MTETPTEYYFVTSDITAIIIRLVENFYPAAETKPHVPSIIFNTKFLEWRDEANFTHLCGLIHCSFTINKADATHGYTLKNFEAYDRQRLIKNPNSLPAINIVEKYVQKQQERIRRKQEAIDKRLAKLLRSESPPKNTTEKPSHQRRPSGTLPTLADILSQQENTDKATNLSP